MTTPATVVALTYRTNGLPHTALIEDRDGIRYHYIIGGDREYDRLRLALSGHREIRVHPVGLVADVYVRALDPDVTAIQEGE